MGAMAPYFKGEVLERSVFTAEDFLKSGHR
jgi:hypothetical protein